MKTLAIAFIFFFVMLLQQSYVIPNKNPPNVVLIFMDDMGYGDLSCYGALDIHTPNLDKLASEGIRFTNFLSSQAVCSASRASLLTGCYANRIGISGAFGPNSKTGISSDEMTIAELLKQKNYATGIFGKWHLGDSKEFLPLQHGFDEYLGIPYSNDMWPLDYDGMPSKVGSNKNQYPPLRWIINNDQKDEIKSLEDQAKITGRITDEAIAFIKKNKKKNFFAYIPSPMPHVPINASPEFKGKSKQGLFGDVIQEIDHHVGKIMQTLKEEGLDKTTMVIFTSDNGPWLNFGNHSGSAGGLREGKGTSFEGGQRVPCIIRWKGTVAPGLVSNQLSSTIDMLPTIATITGTAVSHNKIDGVDLSSILKGDLVNNPRKTFLYYYRRNSLEAIRIDNWKLVLDHNARSYVNQAPGINGYPGKAPENIPVSKALYDLRRDPGEVYDVKEFNPDIVKELELLAEEARADLGDEIQKRVGANNRLPGMIAAKK